MPGKSSSSQRWFRLGFLAVGLGVLVWHSGPRRSVCLPGFDCELGSANVPDSNPVAVKVGADTPEEELEMPQHVATPSAYAPSQEAPQLWEFVAPPPGAEEWNRRMPAPSTTVHYVDIDRALVAGKSAVIWRAGSRLNLPLPDGRVVAVELSGTEARGPDRWVARGHVPGIPGSSFILTASNQHLAASLDGVGPAEIKVRSLGSADQPVVQLYTVDALAEQHCGAAIPGTHLQSQAHAASGSLITTGTVPATANAEPLASGQAVVDILVAYTAAVRSSLGSTDSVLSQIDLGFARVQDDFSNSGITAQLRLAGTMEVSLPGDQISSSLSGWQSTALEQITATQDGIMDDVHARRDALGADLVSLIVRRSDPSSTGIAYLMGGLDSPIARFFAFSVVSASGLSNGVIMSHELGHSFGCAHDRENAGSRGGVFDYSYGYRVNGTTTTGGSSQVRTIMAYSPGSRVRYFSSPDNTISSFSFNGRTTFFSSPVTLGVEEGEAGEANNARTIEQTAFQVANFRLSPDRSEAGRMVNVSTRAWVGSGDRRLIGGFVVNGEGERQILVRAAGPTIGAAPFNVPGALADTLLQVDHIGVGVIAENDDWGSPASNAAAVSSAASVTGAFPFPNGSRDAGTVVNLAQGNYTASVTGASGAEGYGLVEVYEVGSSGDTRLLNLSTRGFADTDRPMVAGFVVNADSGAPGERKSMFIRVRGPSLANYGLPAESLLSDPYIEIYNADAELVYYNDDWDPPSSDIDGTNRDGIPLLRRGQVDQLSEQAVFDAAQAVGATDMEPTEPGVVLELPPGIYTIFVRPFEFLPSQPAEPGVGIVEVFEISAD
ncbi:MAG: hypothetical protein SynsKO_18500 [Synoicihabitans sp.]